MYKIYEIFLIDELTNEEDIGNEGGVDLEKTIPPKNDGKRAQSDALPQQNDHRNIADDSSQICPTYDEVANYEKQVQYDALPQNDYRSIHADDNSLLFFNI